MNNRFKDVEAKPSQILTMSMYIVCCRLFVFQLANFKKFQVEEDLEQPSIMPEKPDLEDDMLTIEDDEVEFPKVAKVSEVPATKNSSNHDIQTTKPPAAVETIAKDSKEPPVKAVSEAITKVTSDRAAASPPCEVSSTTINNEIEKEKGGNKDKSQGTTSSTENTENNQAKAKNITTEVIAETSETVEIEG